VRLSRDEAVLVLRVAAISTWVVALVLWIHARGIPYLRSDLLLWIALGLLAWSVGKRALWSVAVDFVPFAAVLIAYDHLRGVADTLGMPTWWHPQLDVDKAFFGGRVPTVWLQEKLRYPEPRWWDVLASLVYISFFFLPYVTAGVLWLRSRAEFRRWALRFVTMSFVGFGFFALIPSAPPWAAARCSASQVAGHPAAPACMNSSARGDGGLLGRLIDLHGGPSVVQRISTRGLGELHLHFASAVIQVGQVSADRVAAVPSLHAGGVMLFTLFFWSRSHAVIKALMVLYNVAMAWTLVYTAEHYVSDVLAGWLVAAGVTALFGWLEQRRVSTSPVDTLDSPEPAPVP
jgi:hypothetical protein